MRAPQARRPRLPTQKEMNEHYPLHLRYADWCPDCIVGQSRGHPHVQVKGDKSEDIQVDYTFWSYDGVPIASDREKNPI